VLVLVVVSLDRGGSVGLPPFGRGGVLRPIVRPIIRELRRPNTNEVSNMCSVLADTLRL